jgi:hypothetical protein
VCAHALGPIHARLHRLAAGTHGEVAGARGAWAESRGWVNGEGRIERRKSVLLWRRRGASSPGAACVFTSLHGSGPRAPAPSSSPCPSHQSPVRGSATTATTMANLKVATAYLTVATVATAARS